MPIRWPDYTYGWDYSWINSGTASNWASNTIYYTLAGQLLSVDKQFITPYDEVADGHSQLTVEDTMPANVNISNQNASGLTRPQTSQTIKKLKTPRGVASLKVQNNVVYNQLNLNNWYKLASSIQRLENSLQVLKSDIFEPEYFKKSTDFDRPYFLLSDHLKKRRQLYKSHLESIVRHSYTYQYVERIPKLNADIVIDVLQTTTKPAQAYKDIKETAKLRLKQMRAAAKAKVKKISVSRPQAVDSRGCVGMTLSYSGGLPVDNSIGRILNMQVFKHYHLVFQPKVPVSTTKHFGIEIEFVANADAERIARALASANVAKFVHLKTDGSIRTTRERPFAHELTVCVPIDMAKPVIDAICAVLRSSEIDASVNDSCGLHVHLDMRAPASVMNERANKSFRNLMAAQSMLQAMQPEKRRNSEFCRPVQENIDFTIAQRSNRYAVVNAAAYPRHKTIEIRVSSGSVNPEKIYNWAIFLGKIAYNYEGPTSLPGKPVSLNGWITACGMSESLATWAKRRMAKHSPTATFLKE